MANLILSFNSDQYDMEETLVGRWQEDDKVYFVSDDITGEFLTVNKETGMVKNYKGFFGLINDYLNQGIFIVKEE